MNKVIKVNDWAKLSNSSFSIYKSYLKNWIGLFVVKLFFILFVVLFSLNLNDYLNTDLTNANEINNSNLNIILISSIITLFLLIGYITLVWFHFSKLKKHQDLLSYKSGMMLLILEIFLSNLISIYVLVWFIKQFSKLILNKINESKVSHTS